MRSERLFRILGLVDQDLIDGAEAPVSKRRRGWRPMAAIAACLVLALGAGWGAGVLRMGGNSSDTAGGESGHDAGTVFMSYGGPVFPLTAREAAEGVTAEREIAWDFAPTAYDDGSPRQWGAAVTDRYVFTNPTDQDVTLAALYPFTASLWDLERLTPEIALDGAAVQAELCPGAYPGGFTHAGGDPEATLNLDELNSWEQYKALLSGGDYQDRALTPYVPTDIPVTVYQFSDFAAPLGEYPAATQAVSFDLDDGSTTILTYGFNGGEYQEGWRRYSYFVPNGTPGRPETKMLIVLGEDLEDCTLQGYQDGGCDPGEEIDGVSCTVTRRESTLDEVLYEICRFDQAWYLDDEDIPGDLLFRGVMELLTDSGPLAPGGSVDRYDTGMLDEVIVDALAVTRVMYLRFDVTVPAGGTAEVSARLWKQPSHDFICSGGENAGIQGYDLVTRLGSVLDFTRQTAALVNAEAVELVRQNFGFDPAAGVTQVELDPAEERYYLEIRVREE